MTDLEGKPISACPEKLRFDSGNWLPVLGVDQWGTSKCQSRVLHWHPSTVPLAKCWSALDPFVADAFDIWCQANLPSVVARLTFWRKKS